MKKVKTTSKRPPKKIWRTVHPISKIKARPSNLKQRILARDAASSTKASAGKASAKTMTKKDLQQQAKVAAASSKTTTSATLQDAGVKRWNQAKYSCKHCSMTFDNPRALGGHFSKQHKGMSEAYNKKM